jgi:hypothetical protein
MLGRVADGCYAPNRREVGEAEAGGHLVLAFGFALRGHIERVPPLASG